MAAFLDIAKSFPGLVRDGFRSMPLGRTLWFVVLLKLFIMFAVLRAFFFPNFLNSNFDTEREKEVDNRGDGPVVPVYIVTVNLFHRWNS